MVPLLVLLLVTAASACKLDFDCAQCHFCKNGVCTPVADYTDPNDECPERCDVRTVCGPLHICVFEKRPTCNCDWMEGVCIEDEVDLPAPTLEELQARGMSDADIVELLEQLRDEHRRYHKDAHKDHFHILPEDDAAAHDIIFIHNSIMILLFAAVVSAVIVCSWRRVVDEEQRRNIKAQ